MNDLAGHVALVTGAARGQGRCHAVTLAARGADVIAVDVCAQLDTVPYPMASRADLEETVAAVEKLDRRVVARVADVRDEGALGAVVADGVAELGGVDIVVANAGISSVGTSVADEARIFRTLLEVNLTGVWNTVRAAAPTLIAQGRGGSVVLTGSTQALTGRVGRGGGAWDGYAAAKHGLVGLMRTWANWLAPHAVRVNSVHPTGVATPMVMNEVSVSWNSDHGPSDAMRNLLDVPLVEAQDVSNAVAWLVSDSARYITGVALPVDAGFTAR